MTCTGVYCALHAVMQCRMQPVLSCSLAQHVRRAGGVMTAGKLSPETLLTTTTLHWDTQGFSYLGYPSTLKSWYKINVKQGFWSNKQYEPWSIELSYLYYPIPCTVSLGSDTDHSEDWGHSSSDSQSQGVKELHPAVCHTLISAEFCVTLLL